MESQSLPESRCRPPRKHVIGKAKRLCDCGVVMVGRTADGESKLVTILDSVQKWATEQMGSK